MRSDRLDPARLTHNRPDRREHRLCDSDIKSDDPIMSEKISSRSKNDEVVKKKFRSSNSDPLPVSLTGGGTAEGREIQVNVTNGRDRRDNWIRGKMRLDQIDRASLHSSENPEQGTTPVEVEGQATYSHNQESHLSKIEEEGRPIKAKLSIRLSHPLKFGDHNRKAKPRKQSNGIWNEESVLASIRELPPSVSSLLEAAWLGQDGSIEELLKAGHFNIECRDPKGRTPLHLAAAGSHASTVDLLITNGAAVDPCDILEDATPLMCAAAAGSLASIDILLAAGADVNFGFNRGKTPIYWAVQAGSVECIQKLLESGAKQNGPIVQLENPLHISAFLRDVGCLQLLLENGADVSLCRGPNLSTALHIAAEEGNSASMRLLLKAGAPMNAVDLKGRTPLHVAATADMECTSILLAAGANPNALDKDGRSPLHSAISRGNRAAECARLLAENQADINCQDNFGYTPLHLAATNESTRCTSILLHHGADVTMKTNAGTTALSLLSRRIPDVMRFLVDRLDSAVTIHDHDPSAPDCEIRLDFRAVIPNSDKRITPGGKKSAEREYNQEPRKETEFLTCVLATGNKKILNHPLSEAFLTLKWQRVRKFFWASLVFQITLVMLFTTFIIGVYLIECPHDIIFSNQTWSLSSKLDTVHISGIRYKIKQEHGYYSPFTFDPGRRASKNLSLGNVTGNGIRCELETWLIVIWFSLLAFTILMAVKEIFQFLQGTRAYLVSLDNWVQWALIISVFSTAWPANIPYIVIDDWQYPAAAFGLLLAWGLLLLQVGRFPTLGLYVQMLRKVATNFGIVILVYACLLIAFALAFSVIFPAEPAYGSIPLAILKVLTMMVGEVDYEHIFYHKDSPNSPNPFPMPSHLLHAIFVIIVTIVLMNLLVGLAVSDIQGIQKEAKLNRLSRQTALISRVESFIFSRRLQAILPRSIGLILQRSALLVPSSYKWFYYFRPNDPRDKRLPKELKRGALRLASARLTVKHNMKGRNNNYNFDHLVAPNASNTVNPPHGSSINASQKKLDHRLDRLQHQIDLILHTLSIQMEVKESIKGSSVEKQSSTYKVESGILR